MNFSNFKLFLIIINVKILFNFEKEWCTFDKEKNVWKKNHCLNCFEHAKGLLKHHQFASSFEQWNFISIGTLKGKAIENQIYYDPLVIFQKYKIIVLNTCFTAYGSFYCVCTHVCSTYLYAYTYKWCNIIHDHCIIDCVDIALGFSKKIGELQFVEK